MLRADGDPARPVIDSLPWLDSLQSGASMRLSASCNHAPRSSHCCTVRHMLLGQN